MRCKTRRQNSAATRDSNSIIRTRYIKICQKPAMEKPHFFDLNNRYNILRLNSGNPVIAGRNERYKIRHTVQKYFHETRYNTNIAAVYSSFSNNFTDFTPLTTYFFPATTNAAAVFTKISCCFSFNVETPTFTRLAVARVPRKLTASRCGIEVYRQFSVD